MFGIDDAALMMGASVLGGGLFSAYGANKANTANRQIGRENNLFSAKQADINRQFQERMFNRAQDYNTQMSNTSWQRGVADMKAAGINPMLAVSQGGASNPMMSGVSGNSAQGIAQANQQNELQGFANSARDAVRLKYETDLLKAQTEVAKSQDLSNLQNANLTSVKAQLAESEIPGARNKYIVDNSPFGMAVHLTERYGINLNSALSLVKMIRGGGSTFQTIKGSTGEVTTGKTSTWG